jgi:hypothetical protein
MKGYINTYPKTKDEINNKLINTFRNYELVHKEILITAICGSKYVCLIDGREGHDSVEDERQQWRREYVLKKAIKYKLVKYRYSYKLYQIGYLRRNND